MVPAGWNSRLMLLTDSLAGQLFDALDGAAMVVAERGGIVVLAQLDQDFGTRLVLQAAQVLQGQGLTASTSSSGRCGRRRMSA